MPISGFDHVALPTSCPEEMIEFYGRLGFRVPDHTEWRSSGVPFFSALFGSQKINFHAPPLWQKTDFSLRGPSAAPGCGDLCFVWEGGAEPLQALLDAAEVPIEAGPVALEGARDKGTSLYIRDPDANLLEFIIYDD